MTRKLLKNTANNLNQINNNLNTSVTYSCKIFNKKFEKFITHYDPLWPLSKFKGLLLLLFLVTVY